MKAARLDALRALFTRHQIEAMLVAQPHNVGYLSGFTGTFGQLLITRDAAYLVTDFRYTEQAAAQASLFQVLHQNPQGMVHSLHELLLRHGVRRVGFEGNFLAHDTFRTYGQVLDGAIELVPASNLVEKLRTVKDEDEIARMRQAAALADRAFAQILGSIRPGVSERQVALELEYLMKQAGASAVSFDIIVASGARSALPHGVASEKQIAKGDLVTLDFGCIVQEYCSDMTRTVVVGEPSEEQRRIYGIVFEAQARGVAAARAGLTGREADAVCRDYISTQGYGDKFGHSTGHGVGRYIHEGPALSLRGEEMLAAGMVVTIEPGIYLPGWGGVRIEDMVLITETGCEPLSRSPKHLIVL
jgi:Xaa-Pro aminopeptidase